MKTEHFPNSEDVKYKRIYGALAWPGKRPGFICIIGELRQPGLVKFVLLDEKESYDTQDLIKMAGALDLYYKPERWYGDIENRGGMKFLQEYNNTPQAGSRRLRLVPSRLRDLQDDVFTYLYPRLKGMVGENGSLDISKGAKLLGYMAAPQDSDITQIGWGEYPAIEALAFAVFELDRQIVSGPTTKAKHETVKL
jgi:hypothetical protein